MKMSQREDTSKKFTLKELSEIFHDNESTKDKVVEDNPTQVYNTCCIVNYTMRRKQALYKLFPIRYFIKI